MLSIAMFQSTRTVISRTIISGSAKKLQLRTSHSTNFDPEAITPGTSSNVRNPVSDSHKSQAINISRGVKGRPDTADGSSVKSPISSRYRDYASEGRAGEEEATTEAAVRNDPGMSDEEKKRNVEKEGRRPMGPEG